MTRVRTVNRPRETLGWHALPTLAPPSRRTDRWRRAIDRACTAFVFAMLPVSVAIWWI